MKRIAAVFAVGASTLSLGACGAIPEGRMGYLFVKSPNPVPTVHWEPASPAPTPVVSGTLGDQTATVRATVQKVDLKKHRLALMGPDGKVSTLAVAEEAGNLSHVKKGDEVIVTYREAVAYDVAKAGEAKPGVQVSEGVGRADAGQKPGVAATQTATLTATITALDTSAQTATLRGPDGRSLTVKVKDPGKLDKVVVGDLVRLTYTEALIIKVEKPSASN